MRERSRVDGAEVARRDHAQVLVGEAKDVCLVSHHRTAMLDNRQSAMRTDLVAECIGQRIAVVEHTACVNQLLERVTANLMRVVVLVPFPQVVDVGVEPARAHLVEVLDVRNAKAASAITLVAHRTLLHDVARIIMKVRVCHAERHEDLRVGELAEGLSGYALDELREQEVAGVAVRVRVAGFEAQSLLPENERKRSGVRKDILEPVAAQAHQRVDVANAARVVNEMANRDGRAIVRELWKIFPDVVVERELPLKRQQRDARGGELLGVGPDVVDHLGRIRDVVVEIRHAVTALVQIAVVLDGANRAARRGGLVVLCEDPVDRWVRRRLGREGPCEGEQRNCAEGEASQRGHRSGDGFWAVSGGRQI